MTEIERLKAKARKLHKKIGRALDTVDCGVSMLCMLRPSFARVVGEFDTIIGRLKEIDPNFGKAP